MYLFKLPYAIGSVPNLSGHAIAYRYRSLPRVHRHRASKPQGIQTDAALADHHGPINMRLSFIYEYVQAPDRLTPTDTQSMSNNVSIVYYRFASHREIESERARAHVSRTRYSEHSAAQPAPNQISNAEPIRNRHFAKDTRTPSLTLHKIMTIH